MDRCKRYIVIGDIHGHNTWEEIVEREKDADKFIFLGDYFDSFTIGNEEQVKNFNEILEFADNGKTVLLLGNHCYHYLCDLTCSYSGYNYDRKKLVQPLLQAAVKDGKMELVHTEENLIFSHAGVTEYWLNEVCNAHTLAEITFDMIDLSTFDWNYIKGYEPHGDTISNSPIWVRPRSLLSNGLKGYTQIVGHTPVRHGLTNISDVDDIWLCDSLHVGEYLEICLDCDGNRKFNVKKLKV